jgi:hypothetical protein
MSSSFPQMGQIPEMLGFGFGDTVELDAGIARDHKSSRMPLKDGWRNLPSTAHKFTAVYNYC